MKLTVIGCFGAYPEPDGATSGYLLEADGTRILVDCGSGVLARLQTVLPLPALDALVVSHYHPDHDADLGCLHHAAMIDMLLRRRSTPLAAWGPDGLDRLTYGEYCTGDSYLPELSFDIGAFHVEAHANIHEIPSYALRFTAGGKALVYSGDTGYDEALADFARGADLFLCESSFYAAQAAIAKDMHLTSAQTGILAQKAGVGQLLLTHFPHFGDIKQLRAEASEQYTGDLMLAARGMQITI